MDAEQRMRVDGIAAGDIVKASVGGRMIYGEVLEIREAVVYFNPISRGPGWRHAGAYQIVGHWRKAGRRRSGGGEDEGVGVQPPEQLALQVNT
jgi:hypothetical protein